MHEALHHAAPGLHGTALALLPWLSVMCEGRHGSALSESLHRVLPASMIAGRGGFGCHTPLSALADGVGIPA